MLIITRPVLEWRLPRPPATTCYGRCWPDNMIPVTRVSNVICLPPFLAVVTAMDNMIPITRFYYNLKRKQYNYYYNYNNCLLVTGSITITPSPVAMNIEIYLERKTKWLENEKIALESFLCSFPAKSESLKVESCLTHFLKRRHWSCKPPAPPPLPLTRNSLKRISLILSDIIWYYLILSDIIWCI